ncbi:MAG: 2-dehydropantoate 2-reductase [Clostridiales bacterium]|nr:2-dehydropantoate 2-reductase [Clostridiales bacterium]
MPKEEIGKRIAVYGAGSLGTIVGALLSKAGKDVDLIDTNAEHVKALNEKGAKIIGHLDLLQPVKAIFPDDAKEPYDYIIYLTKPTQNESALKQVVRCLKPDGVVVVCQNGMPEEAVAEAVGQGRVVGCVIGWGATWMEPGVSKLTSPVDLMTFYLGELDNQVTERLKAIVDIFNDIGKASIIPDLRGGRWSKLTVNCAFSTMSAVVNGTYGDVIDHPKAIRCAAFIYNEAMAIAAAAGIKPISDTPGFSYEMLTFKSGQELEQKIPIFKQLLAEHRSIKTQMLFDIAAGRYPEIDTTYNGILLRWGEKYKVPTPVNQQVVDIVHQMAGGKLEPSAANVDLITLPDLS